MAQIPNLSALDFAPKEVTEISEFIIESILEQPDIAQVATVRSGVKMKEQLVLASGFSKSGIADPNAARPQSGSNMTLTQKYTEPKKVGDTLAIDATLWNGLWKAYFDKQNNLKGSYDFEGTPLASFITLEIAKAAKQAAKRLMWFGDTATAASGASAAGLVDGANAKFYTPLNGLWKQYFAGVTALTIPRYTIALNSSGADKTAQTTVTGALAKEWIDGVFAKANPVLKSSANAQFLVTGEIFYAYENYLIDKGVAYNVGLQQDGLPTLKYLGKTIINMESIWGGESREDFELTNAHAKYFLPNRIVFTTKENTLVTTINDGEMDEVDAHYDWITRMNYLAYGYTLDALYLEDKLVCVGY